LLIRDVSIARAVLDGRGSVPSGWRVAGEAPLARQDAADGKADPAGTEAFVRCMRLTSAQASDVTRDADQVLNMGGPPLASDGASPQSPAATMTRWVDMVGTLAEARRDWAIYASPRFGECAPDLFFHRAAEDGSRSSGSGVGVTRSFLVLPDGARGIEMRLGGGAGDAGFVIGLATIGTVQASAVLDTPSQAAQPGSAQAVGNPSRLVSEVLAGMVERAVAAGVHPGI